MCPGLAVTFSVTVDSLLPLLQPWVAALPSAGESAPVHNIHVELDVKCLKRAADIAPAFQIPEVMIHTVMKGVQGTETNAVNLSDHSKVNITRQWNFCNLVL
jgi:hypothetical protein